MSQADGRESYKLIVTILNRGYSGEVIDAAREAGAKGGTILHGRGLGSQEVAKFLNIRIEPEKDIVFVLVKKSLAVAVMEAVSERTNLRTPGHGISFALPVDDVLGITEDMNHFEE